MNQNEISEQFDGDLDIALAASEAFVETFQELLNRIHKGFLNQDCKESQLAIHAFKGSISVFGFKQIISQLQLCEKLLKSNNLAEAHKLFELQLQAIQNVYLELANFAKSQNLAA